MGFNSGFWKRDLWVSSCRISDYEVSGMCRAGQVLADSEVFAGLVAGFRVDCWRTFGSF